jgi:hypothetical protein
MYPQEDEERGTENSTLKNFWLGFGLSFFLLIHMVNLNSRDAALTQGKKSGAGRPPSSRSPGIFNGSLGASSLALATSNNIRCSSRRKKKL